MRQGLIGAVEAIGHIGGLIQRHLQDVRVLQPGAPAGQHVGAQGARLGDQQVGGRTAAGQGLQGGDGGGEPGGGDPGGLGVPQAHAATTFNQGQAHLGQGRSQPAAGGLAGLPEGDLGGGVQPLLAEQLGAKQGAEGLFTAGAGPAVGTAVAIKGGSGGLGLGGGLAQGGGVARAAGHLAPDNGGFQTALRLVLGADAAGGDIGGLAFIAQQGQVEQLQQGGIASGQTIPRRTPAPLGAKDPLQLPAELKHAVALRRHQSPAAGRPPQVQVRQSKAGAAAINK